MISKYLIPDLILLRSLLWYNYSLLHSRLRDDTQNGCVWQTTSVAEMFYETKAFYNPNLLSPIS